MPRPTTKRKEAEEGSGDETPRARQKRIRRTSGNTVRFADTVKAVSFSDNDKPKSIRKTKSAPFPTAPGSPDTAESPPPESSMQPEEENLDTEEADKMSKLAAAAIQMVEDAPRGRQEQDLAATQKELASTKKDLENVRFYEKILLESRDLADAKKRAETAQAELREALLANGRLENKLRTLEGRLKSADDQVEKLQREVAVLKEEKAEMERSLGQKTAKETAEVGDVLPK